MQQLTQTMQELGIDETSLQEIINKLNFIEKKENTNVSVAKFKKFPPKFFTYLGSTEDGKLAVTLEVRDWNIRNRSGVSKKIYIRTTYVDNNGSAWYGNSIGSFQADKVALNQIISLINIAIQSL